MLCIDKKFEIICVSETWLDNTISHDVVKLDGYQTYRKDRNRHGGWVAIYVEESVPSKILDDFDIAGVELVCIEVYKNNKSFFLWVVFRIS